MKLHRITFFSKKHLFFLTDTLAEIGLLYYAFMHLLFSEISRTAKSVLLYLFFIHPKEFERSYINEKHCNNLQGCKKHR